MNKHLWMVACVFSAGLSAPIGAQPAPELVANLNQVPGPLGSVAFPPLLRVGEQVVVGGVDRAAVGLWRTDGTEAGTEPLLGLGYSPLCGNTSVTVLAAASDRLFLRFDDCSSHPSLWVSDGTAAGTRMLLRFRFWSTNYSREARLNPDTGMLFFPAADSGGVEPWVSDGTVEGTRKLADLNPNGSSNPILFTPAGTLTYFSAAGEGGNTDLWVTDGTELGTRKMRSFPGDPVGRVLAPMQGFGERLIFGVSSEATGTEPWLSDGTAPGTVPMSLSASGLESSIDAEGTAFVPLGNGAVFQARADAGNGLWFTDGTTGGTRRLLQILADETVNLDPRHAGFQAGRLFFLRGSTQQLWVTDGTVAGTRQLAQDSLSLLASSAGSLLFLRADAQNLSLWRSNGAASGTAKVRELCQLPCVMAGPAAFKVGERVLFVLRDALSVSRLWRSDGAAAGTSIVAELGPSQWLEAAVPAPDGRLLVLPGQPLGEAALWAVSADATSFTPALNLAREGERGSSPYGATLAGGKAFFWAFDQQVGTLPRLYVLPSPEGSPLALTDPLNGGAGELVAVGDRVFFKRGEGQTLMVSDGTATGAQPIYSTDGLDVCGPFAFGSGIAFFRERNLSNWDFWLSDGTAATTRQVVSQVGPNRCTTAVAQLGGNLFFRGSGGDLWRSDGTAAGTTMVQDLAEITSQFGHSMRVSGDRLFFVEQGPEGTRLWVSNGTPAGTIDLSQPSPFPGEIFELAPLPGGVVFAAPDPGPQNFNYEPWVSDGTVAGTVRLKDLQEGLNGSAPFQLTPAADRVYFSADDFDHGRELWVTDGTPAGTRMVADLAPGGLSSAPHLLTAQGSRLVFSADTPHFGRELWVTDGTAASTRRLTDLQPGRLSSAVNMAAFFGDRLLFSGSDGQLGEELWRLPAPGSLEACTSPQDLCLHNNRIRVRVSWRDPRSGNSGVGTALPFSTQSGFFWFFNPANVELVVKVLDGGPVNGFWWTFYGALSDVEYWVEVTDLETGQTETYRNPPRNICGRGDTTSLPKPPSAAESLAALMLPEEPWLEAPRQQTPRGACQQTDQNLCLLGGRFAVTVDWRNPRTGQAGQAGSIPGTDKSGSFWFFNPGNIELVVKMLDGRPVNSYYWLFYGGLSDVEYTIRVTESGTGFAKIYENPFRNICGRGDTTAFFGQ